MNQRSLYKASLLLALVSCLHMMPMIAAFANSNTPSILSSHTHNNNNSNRSRFSRNDTIRHQTNNENENENENNNSNDTDTSTTRTRTRTNKKTGTFNPLRLAVLKLGMTELKWTSPLNYEKRPGQYECANCGTPLFDSSGKYDSGSGWPSFWKTADEDRVAYKREWDGRIECTCRSCGGHLGHAFPDGPTRKDISDISEDLLGSIPGDDLKTSDPNNVYTRLPRYCMNGASLKFLPK